MFLIDINYIVPLEEVDKQMEGHKQYLQKYFDQKIFIVAGRKVPRTGGLILAIADSKETVEKIITEDPYHQHKVADITVTEFSTPRFHPALEPLLK